MPKSSPTYAFAHDETVQEGFVRLLGQIALQAQEVTRPSSVSPEKLIHQGRTLIKRTRALLWFAKPALDAEAFAQARAQLRKAADLMAAQRDLAVVQATLGKLIKEIPAAKERRVLKDLLQTMLQNSSAARMSKQSLHRLLKRAMTLLLRTIDEVEQSAAERRGWKSPRNRLASAFRGEQQAARNARRDDTDVAFHEWRKQAKRLLYLLELTRKLRCGHGTRMRKEVHDLQNTLGHYHDCVVAEDLVRATLPTSDAQRVAKHLERRKRRLRKKAKAYNL